LKIVRHLSKRFNLYDTDSITQYIRRASWTNRRKNNVSYAYRDWCRWKGFDYKFKRFREEQQPIPYIPLEKELDQLIAGFGPKYACYLQMMKETAFRPVEVQRLKPNDIDLERRVVTLNTPAKHSKPRQFRMSSQLTAMITPLIRRTKPNERIWMAKANSIRRQYCLKRKALAEKLGEPKLSKISMRTFRHWKATMEYHRTKDILYVKELLGHHSIKNTLIYTHLVEFEHDDQFIVKVAKSLEDYTKLLELGFSYVSDFDGIKVLRKRK